MKEGHVFSPDLRTTGWTGMLCELESITPRIVSVIETPSIVVLSTPLVCVFQHIDGIRRPGTGGTLLRTAVSEVPESLFLRLRK